MQREILEAKVKSAETQLDIAKLETPENINILAARVNVLEGKPGNILQKLKQQKLAPDEAQAALENAKTALQKFEATDLERAQEIAENLAQQKVKLTDELTQKVSSELEDIGRLDDFNPEQTIDFYNEEGTVKEFNKLRKSILMNILYIKRL